MKNDVLKDAVTGVANAMAVAALMADHKHQDATTYVLGLTVQETQAALIAAATLMGKLAAK